MVLGGGAGGGVAVRLPEVGLTTRKPISVVLWDTSAYLTPEPQGSLAPTKFGRHGANIRFGTVGARPSKVWHRAC